MAKIILYDDYASSYCSVKFHEDTIKVYEIKHEDLVNIKELLKPIQLHNENYKAEVLMEDVGLDSPIHRGEQYTYTMTAAELCPLRHIIKSLIGELKYMT